MVHVAGIDFINSKIRVASIIFEEEDYGNICYYAQIIAESSLRVFLMYNNIPPMKTHNLIRLNELCSTIDLGFKNFFPAIAVLNQFYTSPRYPDEFSEMSPKDIYSKNLAEKSFYHAKEIAEFCKGLIQQKDCQKN